MRKTILRWMVCLALALPVSFAFAQDVSETRTVSEAQLNENLAARAANAGRTQVRTVDLQVGQLVVTGSIPAGRTLQGSFTATYVPVVADGDLRFDLVSFSVNGTSASASRLEQVAAAVSERLENALQDRNADDVNIISVAINDSELTITFTTDGSAPPEEPIQ